MMKFQVVVDRFEGQKAVLLLEDDQQIIWPGDCLPENVSEGDVLTIQVEKDEQATQAARDKADELLKTLLDSQKK